MAAGEKIRIATHIEVEWLVGDFAAGVCPNCGVAGPVEKLLRIDYAPPGAAHEYILQICPACSARFIDNPDTMDYATDELIEIGWNIYQVQLGAGIWPITAPLTRIDKPAGARVLEIGGAYGFGLDFCIRARGWQGEGFDPSPLAGVGARELGLQIHQEYFREESLATGPRDVIIATEVIEHLARPAAFLSLMRRAIARDGMLLLTTPNAERITPTLSTEMLMPLLSPGAHLVLQTASSLRSALLAAGFPQVVVLQDAQSLIAYASPAPFTLPQDMARGRVMYRHYLATRAKLSPPASDLLLGFAGRELFEAANDGDMASADEAWGALLPAVQARFGLDLADLQRLPAAVHEASLAELARLMPLGLGMILFGRAMQLMGMHQGRAAVLPVLRTAAEAVTALQVALARRSLTDGLSASIANILPGEILLCLAEAGDPACVTGFVERGDVALGWRGFIGLVNAGAVGSARELKQAMLPDLPGGEMAEDLRRDALICLANAEITAGGETQKIFDYARALRSLKLSVDHLLLGFFTRLVNAEDYATARMLFLLVEPVLIRLRPPYDSTARAALFSAGVLFLQKQEELRRSIAWFVRLRDELAKQTPPGAAPDALFWPALRGEVCALQAVKRSEEAGILLRHFIATYPGAPDDLREQIATKAGATS